MIDAIPDADQSTAQDRRQHVLSFKNWADFNGDEKPELMAGQHRIEALKDYVKQTDSDSSDLWWICEFYDKGVTPLKLPLIRRSCLPDILFIHTYIHIYITNNTHPYTQILYQSNLTSSFVSTVAISPCPIHMVRSGYSSSPPMIGIPLYFLPREMSIRRVSRKGCWISCA
jgi:hypothetical protein